MSATSRSRTSAIEDDVLLVDLLTLEGRRRSDPKRGTSACPIARLGHESFSAFRNRTLRSMGPSAQPTPDGRAVLLSSRPACHSHSCTGILACCCT